MIIDNNNYSSFQQFMDEHPELDPADTKKHYVAGAMEVYFPVITDDGRPHMKRARIVKDS